MANKLDKRPLLIKVFVKPCQGNRNVTNAGQHQNSTVQVSLSFWAGLCSIVQCMWHTLDLIQQTRDSTPMLDHCWTNVSNAGPPLNQDRDSILQLLVDLVLARLLAQCLATVRGPLKAQTPKRLVVLSPANTKPKTSVESMPGQRMKIWHNTAPTKAPSLLHAGALYITIAR